MHDPYGDPTDTSGVRDDAPMETKSTMDHGSPRGHENFDDMCERYQDAKAAGDNVDDLKVFYKPERPPK